MMNKIIFFLAVGLIITLNSSAQTQILKESFEGSFPPAGWVIQNNGNGNNWIQDIDSADAFSGTKCMQYYYNDTSAANTWAYTPLLNLNGLAVTVTFYVKAFSFSFPENLKLTVGKDSTTASQTTVLLDIPNITDVTYQKYTATFTPSSSGNYRFALNCYSSVGDYALYIDSVTIYENLYPCTGTPVGGKAYSSLSTVCSSNTFILTDSGATSGFIGLNYQWQSSSDSITWKNMAGAINENDTLSNLVVPTYYRRAIICANGGTAYSSGVLVKANPFFQCICGPNTGTILHTTNIIPAIDTVAIIGTVLNNITPTSSIPIGGYSLYNDSTKMPSLLQAKTYSLKTSFTFSCISSVWFDWNQNGVFDSTEWTQLVNNAFTSTLDFTVPPNALLGKTLMRIRSKRNASGTNNAQDACSTFTNGETEDYLINVVAGNACTGTPKGGTIVSSINPICPINKIVLTDTGATAAVTGLSYQWQSSKDSVSWTNIAGTKSITDTITGLNTNTFFRKATYCITSGLTGYSNVIKEIINPANYCVCSPLNNVALYTSFTGAAIDTVTIKGTTLNSITSTTIPANGYTFFNDTTKTPAFLLGQSYNLTTSFSQSAIASVWFDWDQSGTFDSIEWKQIIVSGATGTINFTVPANAKTGKTIMRIRSRNVAGINGPSNACTPFNNGETEDYLVNVLAANQCTGTPTGGIAIASQNPVCSSVNLVLSDSAATSNILGLSYQWQSSSDGNTWANLAGATKINDTISGLITPTYFRRVITCSNSNQSGYSIGILINIIPVALCVCSPNTGITLHSAAVTPAIDTVTILGTVLNNITPKTVPAGGYTLYNDTAMMPSLQQSQTYTLKTTYNSASVASVWFDWNQNGLFESNEWTQLTTTVVTSGTIKFTVPANAATGKTIMRVRILRYPVSGTTTNTALNACTTFKTGETEDYLINIVAPIQCSGTPTGGTIIASANPICTVANLILSDTTATWGISGLTVQWQSSPNGINWTDIAGATAVTDTVKNLTTPTYFRRGTTCITSGLTGYSNSMLENVYPTAICVCSPNTDVTLHGGSGPPAIDTVIVAGTALTIYPPTTVPPTGYTLYYDTTIMPNLVQGKTYSIKTSYSTQSVGAAWFDWDRNGSFDSTEFKQLTTNGYKATTKFTVPVTATPGKALMRLRSVNFYARTISSTDACTTFNNSGETEDFLINIIPAYNIEGEVVYPNKVIVPNTTVKITGTAVDSTNVPGSYLFSEAAGGNYTLRAFKNNDINKANGITTLDLALIQSHILGKTILNSPYKIIAADVNKDNKVTTLDLVYIKRLILGIDTVYPSKTLWAFVDSSYSFADQSNPFPYRDSISILNFTTPVTNKTFIGIKMGDVNWDWNPALARPAIPARQFFIKPKRIY